MFTICNPGADYTTHFNYVLSGVNSLTRGYLWGVKNDNGTGANLAGSDVNPATSSGSTDITIAHGVNVLRVYCFVRAGFSGADSVTFDFSFS
jgi:hypothetical protein